MLLQETYSELQRHLFRALQTFLSFQSLPSHGDSTGRLRTAGGPLPARPHRLRRTASDVSRLHVLHHCSRRFTLWPEVLPIPDITADTVARIPGKLLSPAANPVDPAHLITELRQNMARLRPVPASRHVCFIWPLLGSV
jgi:hypothetical protein